MQHMMNQLRNLGSHRWNQYSNRKLEYLTWDKVPSDIEYQRDVLKRSFYDRDNDKVILLFFKSGAGGLFLANALSLSSKVNSSFLNIKEKVKLIYEYLENQNGLFWNDLYINNYYPDVYEQYLERDEQKSHTTDGYFFVHEHEPENIKEHLKFWTNCNVIYFKNPDLFCRIRKLLKNVDGIVSYMSYESVPARKGYNIPSSISEFISLPKEEKDKLIDGYIGKHGNDLYPSSFIHNRALFYPWDTNWYFSEKDTVDHIEELYTLLGMEDFNKKVITFYYRKWISKLDELSKRPFPSKEVLYNALMDNKTLDRPISSFESIRNNE